MNNYILANWTAPAHISAMTTTRLAGVSEGPYAHNNLALHVGDDAIQVGKNRQQLIESLSLPAEPIWLEQTHSTDCIVVEETPNRLADAAVTRNPAHALVVLTADCLPLALTNIKGEEIAMIHAGWRGLANGIIENTLRHMQSPDSDILVWIGPAICKNCFEVGDDVYNVFINRYPFTRVAFKAHGSKWLADLALIAELILNSLGVEAIFHSQACTYEQNNDFYSYRRQAQTGRIATLIWFNHKTGNDNDLSA